MFDLKHELHNGDKVAIAAIILAILAGFALYSYLPEKVASHWNLNGIPDGFIEKELFIVGFPVLMLLSFLALSLLPAVKELKYEMRLLHSEYAGFKAAILSFLAYVYIVVLYANSDFSPLNISTSQLIFPGISVLLYYLARIMPRLKRNHFVGIRTPWTVHNDETWHKTHLLGSKLFKALSVVVMFATLTAATISTWLVIVPLLAVGVLLVVYSYAISRKLKQKGKSNSRKKVKTKRKRK